MELYDEIYEEFNVDYEGTPNEAGQLLDGYGAEYSLWPQDADQTYSYPEPSKSSSWQPNISQRYVPAERPAPAYTSSIPQSPAQESTRSMAPTASMTDVDVDENEHQSFDNSTFSPRSAEHSASASTSSQGPRRSRNRGRNPSPKQQQLRATCTSCGDRFRQPKTIESTKCSGCREREKPVTAPSSGQSTITLPADDAAFATPSKWDAAMGNLEQAKQQLAKKAQRSVGVDDDDFDQLDAAAIDRYTSEMFAAIPRAPSSPDDEYTDEKKRKFCDAQLISRKKCASALQTADGVSDASARCRLAVEEAITLHEDGILTSELTANSLEAVKKFEAGPKTKRRPPRLVTTTGFNVDSDVICTRRLELIAYAIAENKLVTLELLDGHKVSDLIRCPTHFLDRKVASFVRNLRSG